MSGMDREPVYQRCIGRVKREGMRKRKDGTVSFCRVYETEPCGWETGVGAEDIPSSVAPEPVVVETPSEGHTTSPGRLRLSDYRAG